MKTIKHCSHLASFLMTWQKMRTLTQMPDPFRKHSTPLILRATMLLLLLKASQLSLLSDQVTIVKLSTVCGNVYTCWREVCEKKVTRLNFCLSKSP